MHVTEHELALRRSRGLDRWDEVWDGVLHLTPAPSVEHLRILDELIMILGRHLTATGRGTLRLGINLFRDQGRRIDYRIPDLTFVAAGHEHILLDDGVRGGCPDAVIEIRAPEDETYEKLPFYAALRIREVIVIERDTRRLELHRLDGAQYVTLQPDREGWLRSDTMGVQLRWVNGAPPRLAMEDVAEAAVRVEI